MNIDFHTHVNLSKTIAVTLEELLEKMAEAKQSGLDAVALTEHFNAVNFLHIYDMLDAHFPISGDCYIVNGVKVFPGIEIDVAENGHFLAVADSTIIRRIRNRLNGHEKEGHFIPVQELADFLKDLPVLKIAAHPFRVSTPWTQHEHAILNQFDAFDINGKDLYRYGEVMKQQVEDFAARYDAPAVGGSDTHQFFQYGSVINEFPDCDTVGELKHALISRNYTVQLSPALQTKVRAAKYIKKMLKLEYS
ncbi:PHP domain-containing protein [Marinococcus sp. PL1-022]|uniref:PHP domain-containing protein n=1 Tax=Marinococcus sp. PL1-022 TaxID=3095363 RepID=UPI0029C2A652|nr:PHP-associated domain-containing protein [Marinococcus sp. PL1-022]MDX6152783.1 PHP domain-containing protein [Marinococcus sp. PL1-022]